MYLTLQELCQKLNQALNTIYNSDNINNIAEYIYKSTYYKNNISILFSADFLISTHFEELLQDLKRGRPVQYCLGEAVFMDLELYVDERVLIPRPETEELVDWCTQDYKFKKESLSVLDIGTGSGAIAISISKKFPTWNVEAIDISDEILELVRFNADKYKLNISLIKLNFLTENNILGKYDMIISNPPYISNSEMELMTDSVLKFEPHVALFSPTTDPDVFYKSIAEFGLTHLNDKGAIYCELNEFRSHQVVEIFKQAGYKNLEMRNDLQGKARMIKASLS